jgi:hypothetical protein
MATVQAKSIRRHEDLRLLTGQSTYAADAAPPHMAVAIFPAPPTPTLAVRQNNRSGVASPPSAFEDRLDLRHQSPRVHRFAHQGKRILARQRRTLAGIAGQ